MERLGVASGCATEAEVSDILANVTIALIVAVPVIVLALGITYQRWITILVAKKLLAAHKTGPMDPATVRRSRPLMRLASWSLRVLRVGPLAREFESTFHPDAMPSEDDAEDAKQP